MIVKRPENARNRLRDREFVTWRAQQLGAFKVLSNMGLTVLGGILVTSSHLSKVGGITLHKEQAQGWVTLSRHASAPAAAAAMYEFCPLLQRKAARIVEVPPEEIVRDQEPDVRPSPRVIGTCPDGET